MAAKKQGKQPSRTTGQAKKPKAGASVPFAQTTREMEALMKKHGLKTEKELAQFLSKA